MQMKLRRSATGGIAFQGASLFAWMLIRAGCQAAMVLLLAKILGAERYGQFVALVAVASFFSPFVGLGLASMMLRNGARDPNHIPQYFSRTIDAWKFSFAPLAGCSILVSLFLLPSSLPQVAASVLLISEIAAVSLTEVAARFWQCQHRIGTYGAVNAGLPGVRLLAAALLILASSHVEISTFFWTYSCSNLIYVVLLWTLLPSKKSDLYSTLPEPMTPGVGLPFAFSTFSVRVQSELNKPALAQLGFGLAGIYNVAQRGAELASMPLWALQEALWPWLYSKGDDKRTFWMAAASLFTAALLLGVGIWGAAPFVTDLFGHEYATASKAMAQLSFLPLLQAIRSLINFRAIQRGNTSIIGWAYGIGAMLGVILIALLIPILGIFGAVASSYLTEFAMIITLLLGLEYKRRRSDHGAVETAN